MDYYVAEEYTDAPGGRYYSDGPKSGQDFRENVLLRLIEQRKDDEKIKIIFDGAYGYPTSFLEEAFGGLARIMGAKNVLDIFIFESNDLPQIVQRINDYINGVKE